MGGHVDEVGNRLSSKIGTLSFMPFDPITYVELSKIAGLNYKLNFSNKLQNITLMASKLVGIVILASLKKVASF